MMKIKYPPQVDALYISFKQRPTEASTVRLSEDVAIDLGRREEVVGIEVLAAPEHLSSDRLKPKVLLDNLEPA